MGASFYLSLWQAFGGEDAVGLRSFAAGPTCAARPDTHFLRPGCDDLPVRRLSRFELVVNMTTARALDLTVPARLLAVTDRVVE
jgi:hypothetical protein